MKDELERIAARCYDPEDIGRQCNQQAAAPSQQACYEAWNATHPQQAHQRPQPEQAWPFNWFG